MDLNIKDEFQIYNPKEQKILIVDDSPENIDILAEILSEYKRMVAINGEKALSIAFSDNKPDLILLDIEMPVMNGFEVCDRLRKNESTQSIPIIFLTAQTARENILKGFQLGAQDYITKPFDARELMARIKTHLELKENREKLRLANKLLEEKVIERTEQLKIANIELMSLDYAKAEFLRIISHEIRTPLNGILGPLYLLKERTKNEELMDLVNILDLSVSRLERFSEAALKITSLRTKNYVLNKQPINMNELVDLSLSELNDKIVKKSLTVTRNIVAEPLVFMGEMDLLKLGLINILLNAIKYSDKYGIIIINTMQSANEICCAVSDHGPGFSEKSLNNLFRLFSPIGQHFDENVGLDLAMVKLIIDVHEGKIEASNTPEGGATIKFSFNPTL